MPTTTSPMTEEERRELLDYAVSFRSEGTTFWREFFIERDTGRGGKRFGMYDEGDELRPFFSEAFLYNLLGKDEARSVLSIHRRLLEAAGFTADEILAARRRAAEDE